MTAPAPEPRSDAVSMSPPDPPGAVDPGAARDALAAEAAPQTVAAVTTENAAAPENAAATENAAGSENTAGSENAAVQVAAPDAGSPGPPSLAPAPPRGPGVQAPFAAPPVDGDRTRVWVGLLVGAVALIVCCGGGLLGFVGLIVTSERALNEQAQATVRGYLDALKDGRFADAYRLQCDAAQRRETPQSFTERESEGARVASYTLRRAEIGDAVRVPADVRFTSGEQTAVTFQLAQDRQTGEFEVCGIE